MTRLSILLLLATTAGAFAAEPVLVLSFSNEKLEFGSGDLADARPGFDQQTNRPVVFFRMSREKARAFGEMTTRHVGEGTDLIVCGKVLSSPVIRELILSGAGQISGAMTAEDAARIAVMLREGRCE